MPVHADLAQGAQIGRFTVLKKLGKGGMGVVHLAYDPELDRRVAIKLLHDTADHDLSGGRLLREAKAMARLSHANVVAVYEVGEYEGALFVAMEYVQGATLRQWERAGPRKPREVLDVLVQAGRGLAAAHAAGLLHRDFKPDNVIVDDEGRARVLDFGLARPMAEMPLASAPALPLTESMSDVTDRMIASASAPTADTMSLVAGTPAYMGPEQLLDGRSDERSDQFAFCVTLYEALTGVRPFECETVGESIAAKKHGRLSTPLRAIAPRLRAIVVRGLNPDPEKRWPSMASLVDALDGVLRRRTNLALLAVASTVAIVAAIVLSSALHPAKVAMCVGLDRELAGVWDDAVRADVARGLRATGHKNAEATIARVVPALDGYVKGWTLMSVDACEDARVRGTQSMEALDLRTTCLDRRVKEIRATTRILAAADANVVDRAVKLVEAISPVDGCADLAALREPTAPPRDPGARASVDHARDLIAQAKALFSSGRYPECALAADDAARESRRIGARALEAEALHWRGMTAYYLPGGAKEAAATMLDAAVAAEAARHDEFAVLSWTWLTHFVGYALDRPEEAERYARLAEAAIVRRGGDPAATAHLLKVRGNVVYGQGKNEEALVLYRQAVSLLEQQLGRGSTRVASARVDIGDGLYDRGDRAGALAIYRESAATLVSAFGENNPDAELVLQRVAACEVSLALPTALASATRAHEASAYDDPDVEDNLGQALILAGRTNEGLEWLRRAIERAPALLNQNQVLNLPMDLARALLREGRVREAGIEIARVRAEAARLGTLDTREQLFVEEALWNARAGHSKDAVADATQALGMLHKLEQDDVPESAIADLALGEAKLALHAPQAAIAPLEHALSVAERGLDPVWVGDIRTALARALERTHVGGDRTATLLARAADDYARGHHPERAALAAATPAP